MKQKQKYVETISGINVSNGVVKIYFINEDEDNLANGFDETVKNNANLSYNSLSNRNSLKANLHKTNQNNSQNSDQKIFMKHDHTLIMPISGFMYMVSVIKNLLENSQMQEQIEKYIEAGLLPKLEPQENSFDQENSND